MGSLVFHNFLWHPESYTNILFLDLWVSSSMSLSYFVHCPFHRFQFLCIVTIMYAEYKLEVNLFIWSFIVQFSTVYLIRYKYRDLMDDDGVCSYPFLVLYHIIKSPTHVIIFLSFSFPLIVSKFSTGKWDLWRGNTWLYIMTMVIAYFVCETKLCRNVIY